MLFSALLPSTYRVSYALPAPTLNLAYLDGDLVPHVGGTRGVAYGLSIPSAFLGNFRGRGSIGLDEVPRSAPDELHVE